MLLRETLVAKEWLSSEVLQLLTTSVLETNLKLSRIVCVLQKSTVIYFTYLKEKCGVSKAFGGLVPHFVS